LCDKRSNIWVEVAANAHHTKVSHASDAKWGVETFENT
jgi:hypothetical protein